MVLLIDKKLLVVLECFAAISYLMKHTVAQSFIQLTSQNSSRNTSLRTNTTETAGSVGLIRFPSTTASTTLQPSESESFVCGAAQEFSALSSRIISGNKVRQPQEAPYQVRLSKDQNGLDHYCSGVIIDPYTILTAARCLMDAKGVVKNVYVTIGDTTINDPLKKTSPTLNVTDIRVHSLYKPAKGFYMNDIGMLKLSDRLESRNGTVNSVCLPKSDVNYKEDEPMFVTGWGYINNEHEKSVILRRAKLFPLSDNQCKKDYGKEFITKEKMCAKNVYEAPCLGDWGAPLVRKVNGKYELVGLFSTNRKLVMDDCLKHPSVYTRVSSFLDWINLLEN